MANTELTPETPETLEAMAEAMDAVLGPGAASEDVRAHVAKWRADRAALAEARRENMALRMMAWMSDPSPAKYGDDGEMQAGGIDYWRWPVDKIQDARRQRGLAALAASSDTHEHLWDHPFNGKETCLRCGAVQRIKRMWRHR